KEELDKLTAGEILEVWVDNESAVQNVSRFAQTQGHKIQIKALEDGTFLIQIQKQGKGKPVGEIS
ncbi:MAG: hypothetical protein DSY82_00765, partial [Flavobacteriia bacterium]